MFQTVVVALLVIGCTAYAAWALMPTALRRSVARHLLAWPLPAGVAARMRRHAEAAGGCACDGCDRGTARQGPKPTVQTIRFHPRARR